MWVELPTSKRCPHISLIMYPWQDVPVSLPSDREPGRDDRGSARLMDHCQDPEEEGRQRGI